MAEQKPVPARRAGAVLWSIPRRFGAVLIVFVVLLAVYVGAGRQFMPAVSGYSAFLESRLQEIVRVPVRVDAIAGHVSGFNPVIEVNGLSMHVSADSESPQTSERALVFDRGTVVVDMARSIWQRRWVLREFVVEHLELELQQTGEGDWLLGGIAMGSDADSLYRAFLNIAQLDLRDVVVTARALSGKELRFIDGAVTIQNRAGNHFLHIEITPEGQDLPFALSLEVRGGELAEIDGDLHVAIPAADYSDLLFGREFAGVGARELIGSAEIWVNFERGQARRIVADAALDRLTLESGGNASATIAALDGALEVFFGEDATRYSVTDLSFEHEGARWPGANIHAAVARSPERVLSLRADRVDVEIVSSLAAGLGFLPPAVSDPLAQLRPAGVLENLAAQVPLREDGGGTLSLKANTLGAAVASLRNSPAMSGLTGYLEVSADLEARRAAGLLEVDSTDFTINIPRVYTSTWAFDAMNGSVEFDFDYNHGRQLRVGSSVLAGRLGAIEARLQLTSAFDQQPDGARGNELELLIGVYDLSAAEKTPFLPDGPGIEGDMRAGMEFLERALVDGHFSNSAAIFRGQTTQGSDRITKTFQSFYQWHDGSLRFDPEWPLFESGRTLVLTDDDRIDVVTENGRSLGLRSDLIQGSIRPGEAGGSVLSVIGEGETSSADGLAWLQSIPAAEGLRRAMSGWRMRGAMGGGFALEIPLGSAEAETEMRLRLDVADNDLWISQYELDLTDVDGGLVFDTRTGIESGEFTAGLFGGDTVIQLSSRGEPDGMARIDVVAKGRAERREVMAWPRQSDFVKELLNQARGSFLYAAELHLDPADTGVSSLRVGSDLGGLFLDLPEPFAKQAGEPLPFWLQIDRDGAALRLFGSVDSRLRFDWEMADADIRRGRVRFSGGRPGAVAAEGTVLVDGRMDRLVLGQWAELLGAMGGDAGISAVSLGVPTLIDIDIGLVDVYGQKLEDVGLAVESAADGWLAGLSGAAVQGRIEIPSNPVAALSVELDHLRFQSAAAPSEAAAATGGEERSPPPRVDLLARIDPRALPPMSFAVDEFSIGETAWGAWDFQLEPSADGAEISDLSFDFRGLRSAPNPAEPSSAAHLRWLYDGENHATELAGLVRADDMADVLLRNGFAASLESESARFAADLRWPGSPAFFQGSGLQGNLDLLVENGRFLETNAGGGALKLISIINFNAIMRRLRFSDDLLRRGLAFDEISGRLHMENGLARIEDQLVISGPSSLYQITGEVDLRGETIDGEMYVTLPVSDNIPWIGLITGNLPLAVGAYLFDRIFGNQVDSLTSAVYTLEGPWEGLEPQFKQAFGSPGGEVGSN